MRDHWSSVSSWNRDTIPGFQNPAGKFIRHALVLDVASVKRVRQQVPHGIDGELRPARGEVTSAVQVLTDAPDRERRLTEERIERPPDGLGLLGDQLAISRP